MGREACALATRRLLRPLALREDTQRFFSCRVGGVGPDLCFVAGCTTPRIPPLTAEPTGIRDAGRVIAHELATLDIERSSAFYSAVFGWRLEEVPGTRRNYRIIRHGDRILGGVFEFDRSESGGASSGEWIPVFSTTDVRAAATAIEAGGGEILFGPKNLPERGEAVLASDPRKAVFLVLRTAQGDPDEGDLVDNGFLWDELWTDDLDRAIGFYGELFGFRADPEPGGFDHPYRLFRNGERVRAGVMQIDNPEVRPHWVPFIKVSDVNAVVQRASEAGATVVIAPNKDVRDGRAALILDPLGAPVALQEYEPSETGE